MAINFPDSPSVDEIYSVGDKSWLWNGTYWEVQGAPSSTFSASDTAPADPDPGDIWYRSDTSQTLLFYDNTWVEIGHSANVPTFFADNDADTKIQVEESADEDTIRFDTAGSERVTIGPSGDVVVYETLTVNGGASVGGSVIPTGNETLDLGSAEYRFRDLYLSGSSIDLGGATISSDGTSLTMPPMASLEVGNTSVSNNKITVTSANNTSAIVDMLSDNTGTKGFRVKYEGNGNYFAIADVESGVITDHFTIDFNGHVALPNQPIFLASHNSSSLTTGTIIWGSVHFNIGSHYNPSNGRFTAPAGGVYMFLAWTLINMASSGEVRFETRVNGGGSAGHRHIDQKPANQWYTIRQYGMLNLNAGDYVTMHMAQNPGTLYGDPGYNGFTMAKLT